MFNLAIGIKHLHLFIFILTRKIRWAKHARSSQKCVFIEYCLFSSISRDSSNLFIVSFSFIDEYTIIKIFLDLRNLIDKIWSFEPDLFKDVLLQRIIFFTRFLCIHPIYLSYPILYPNILSYQYIPAYDI